MNCKNANVTEWATPALFKVALLVGRWCSDTNAAQEDLSTDPTRHRHLCCDEERSPSGRWKRYNKLLSQTKTDKNTLLNVHGAIVSMNHSFAEFGVGLIISVLLIYRILMAQFTSFIDPFIILMAIPPGLAGVVLMLFLTGSTLNHHVYDGRNHDDWHRGLEQYPDRRVCRHIERAGTSTGRSRRSLMSCATSPDPDDIASYTPGHDSDGSRP
jgi:hypothetical protein